MLGEVTRPHGWCRLASAFGGVLDGMTTSIRSLLGGIEALLVQTPWMVTATIILAAACRGAVEGQQA